MKKIKLSTLSTLVFGFSMAFTVAAAHADSLNVLSAAAVKTSLTKAPEAFSQYFGDSVAFQYATAGGILEMAFGGTAFDVVILPPKAMAELGEKGLVDLATQKPLGTVRLGAAVAKGAALPDMSSVDALKRVLLLAPSIGIADPEKGATTGVYLAKLFTTLGLDDKLIKSKVKYYPDGQNAMEAVARHEVALGLGQISEAIAVEGLGFLTPLPEASQLKTTYAIAMSTSSKDKPAAQDLYNLLLGEDVGSALTANGFDVPAR